MARYHINDQGKPGVCRAQKGQCPFGSAEKHFDSLVDAMVAYEEQKEQGKTHLIGTMKQLQTAEEKLMSSKLSVGPALTFAYGDMAQEQAKLGNYEAQMAYTVAEDLSDGVLKQMPIGAPARLISAFRSNEDATEGQEKAAWRRIVTIAEKFFQSRNIEY